MNKDDDTGGYEYTCAWYGDEDLIINIRERDQRYNKKEGSIMRTYMSRRNNYSLQETVHTVQTKISRRPRHSKQQGRNHVHLGT